MKLAKNVLLTVSLCLLLTSCFRVENSVKVHEDGAVDVQQILAINAAEFSPEMIGMEGGKIPRGARGAFCDGVKQGIRDSNPALPGQQVDDYKSGNHCGVRISMEIDAAPDHSEALSAIFQQNTRLVAAAGGWEFETTIFPEKVAKDAGFKLSDLEDAFDSAEFLLHVDLPGSAIDGEHNATKVKGGRFTWEIDPLNPNTRLYARTGPVTGLDKLPVSPKVLGVIMANLAVIGGLGFFFLRDEKPQASAAVASEVPAGMGSIMEGPAAVAAAATPGTPYFNEDYGIWMLDDPERGLLWHREGTDEWVAF